MTLVHEPLLHGILLTILATIACVASLIVHAAIWRLSATPWSTGTLIALIIGADILSVCVFATPFLMELFSLTTSALGIIMLLSLAMAASYIGSYPAVEANSPTFIIADTLKRAGANGMTMSALMEEIPKNSLVSDRIDDLIKDGLAIEKNGDIVITAKGRALIYGFVQWKKLLSEPVGG